MANNVFEEIIYSIRSKVLVHVIHFDTLYSFGLKKIRNNFHIVVNYKYEHG